LIEWIRRVLGISYLEERLSAHMEAEENTKSLGIDLMNGDARICVFDSATMSVRFIDTGFPDIESLDKFVESVRSAYGVPRQNVYTHQYEFPEEGNRWRGRSYRSRGR